MNSVRIYLIIPIIAYLVGVSGCTVAKDFSAGDDVYCVYYDGKISYNIHHYKVIGNKNNVIELQKDGKSTYKELPLQSCYSNVADAEKDSAYWNRQKELKDKYNRAH